MATLREAFPPESRNLSTVLLGEDWQFQAAHYPALADLAVVHEDTSFCEAPTAVLRRIALAHPLRRAITVQLDVALALNGASDAADLLFDFVTSFERPIPTEKLLNTAVTSETGDFGLAWSWSEDGSADVVAFIRHNALVMLQGHQAEKRLLPAARQIDTMLRGLRTVAAYPEDVDGFFAEARRAHGTVPRVQAKTRLNLGPPTVPAERYFFVTSGGSVNRDRHARDAWYYRAGMYPGRREIVLFRLGAGLLPTKERLLVDVEQK